MALKYQILGTYQKLDKPLTITIGCFDIFHLGHQKLLEKTIEISKASDTIPCVFSFTFPFNKPQLMQNDDKVKFLNKIGINTLFLLEFNQSLKNTSPLEFIEFLKCQNVKNIIVGDDFKFGISRSGDVELLKKHFVTEVIKTVKIDEEKISSSTILELLKDGDFQKINRLLNYPYFVTGEVLKGFQNGHKIGFKTINISPKNYPEIKCGVYSGTVEINKENYLGMIYVGRHQTINCLDYPIIEMNIFNFSKYIYGQKVTISFFKRISDDFNFKSVEDLKKALIKYKDTILSEYSVK